MRRRISLIFVVVLAAVTAGAQTIDPVLGQDQGSGEITEPGWSPPQEVKPPNCDPPKTDTPTTPAAIDREIRRCENEKKRVYNDLPIAHTCAQADAARARIATLNQRIATYRATLARLSRQVNGIQRSVNKHGKLIDGLGKSVKQAQATADAAKTAAATAQSGVDGLTPRMADVENTLNGYTDSGGEKRAGLQDVVWGSNGQGGMVARIGELYDKAADVASANWLWFVGVVAVLALVIAAFALLKTRSTVEGASSDEVDGLRNEVSRLSSEVATATSAVDVGALRQDIDRHLDYRFSEQERSIENILDDHLRRVTSAISQREIKFIYSPDHGPAAGGTSIALKGPGFHEPGTKVWINGAELVDVDQPAPDTITGSTPPGERGPRTLKVEKPDGQVLEELFIYD